MGSSLQDQLRALGLAGKPAQQQTGQRARERKSRRESVEVARQQHPGDKPADHRSAELSLEQAWALREQEEQRKAQEARSRKLEEDRRRREINARVRAIVESGRLNRDDAEVTRNFLFRGRIRKLYVTREQQRALSADELGIVYLAGSYHLLAREHMDAVRAISAGHVVELQHGAESEEGFPVPDDLNW